jgi:hypothetical protein
MKKEVLKRQILVYLLFVFGVEVFLYVFLNFQSMSEMTPKSHLQIVFYGVALFMPFFFGWLFFGASHVIVRKCENCDSKNIRYAISRREGFICDDCDTAVKIDFKKNTSRLILSVTIPLLFLGPFFLLGNVLAGGELSKVIIELSFLFSIWFPSFVAIIFYSMNLMDKSAFFNEHKILGLTLFFALIIIGLLIGFILLTI